MEDNIQRSLGRIEGKLDAIQEQQKSITKSTCKNTKDISEIRQTQSYTKGQASVWGIIGGILVTVIVAVIKSLK